MATYQEFLAEMEQQRQQDLELKTAQLRAAKKASGYGMMANPALVQPSRSTGSSVTGAGYYTGPSVTGGTGSITSQVPGAGTVISTPNISGQVQSQAEQERYDPWSRYRGQAGEQLAGQMGQPSPSDIYQQKLAQMATGEFSPDDPSYQFRFQEGQRAAERSLASRGLLGSGNAAIELQERGQQAASQEYDAQFGRLLQGLTGVESAYNTQIGRLMEMAGVGIDPTAGGRLNVEQGQLGVQRGQLGLNAQEIANRYDLGMKELSLKEKLAEQAATTGSFDWSKIYSGGSSGATASWDEYFANKQAAQAAQQQAQFGL